ncbi:phage minor head protein [Dehalococcoidia bacterium]|nr:phage minor head protein [Dehalococcoidia bacterium]
MAQRLAREANAELRKARDKVIEAQRKDWKAGIDVTTLDSARNSLKAVDSEYNRLLKVLKSLVDSFIAEAWRLSRAEAFKPVVTTHGAAISAFGNDYHKENLQEPPLTPAERRLVKTLSQLTYEAYRTVASEWWGRTRTNIAVGVVRGEDMATVSRRIRQQCQVRQSDAMRIARTETARVSEHARMQEFKARRVEKLDIVLGPNPCERCADLVKDNPYKREKAPSVPIHPNCMCALAPVIEDLPEAPPPEGGWMPMVINAGYSDLERRRLNRMLNKLPERDKQNMMRFLSSEDNCPVILHPKEMKRRFGFDAEVKYGRDYKPYTDWAGLYEPSENRVWILPEHRGHALIHEIAHQYYHRGVPLGTMRHSQVWNGNYGYYEKAKAAGRAVTEYALTNEREYFAEGVKFFIQDPRRLYQRDKAMYRFLNEKVFPGTYKRLPRPGVKLEEAQVG